MYSQGMPKVTVTYRSLVHAPLETSFERWTDIPKEILLAWGLQPGDVLEWTLDTTPGKESLCLAVIRGPAVPPPPLPWWARWRRLK